MKKVTQGIILLGSLALSAVAMAEPFDGNKIMLCANQYASECVAGTDCVNVSPGSVNLPNFFQITAELFPDQYRRETDQRNP
jgi:hypothetical protein